MIKDQHSSKEENDHGTDRVYIKKTKTSISEIIFKVQIKYFRNSIHLYEYNSKKRS